MPGIARKHKEKKMLKAAHKQWLTPFLGVTFFAVSFTGVVLLFHHKAVGMNQIHQWGGILFILGGILHLLLNWRGFQSYFRNSRAVMGVCAGVVTIALLVMFFPLAGDHGKNRGHSGWDKGRGYYLDNSAHR